MQVAHTTCRHCHDVAKLLEVLHELVAGGNTVVVIEHNLEVIKTADWIIDLGPEGGDGGGEIVAAGPPEAVVKEKRSYTGAFLKPVLGRRGVERRRDAGGGVMGLLSRPQVHSSFAAFASPVRSPFLLIESWIGAFGGAQIADPHFRYWPVRAS